MPDTVFLTSSFDEQVDLTKPDKVVKLIKARAKEPEAWWTHAMSNNVEYLFTRYVETKMRGYEALKERRLNILELIADTTVDRIKLSGWKAPNQTVYKRIANLEKQMGLAKFSRDQFLRTEIQGIYYILVWPSDEDSPGIIRATPATTTVGFHDDGSSVWPKWAARLSKKGTRLDVFYEDHYEYWIKKNSNVDQAQQVTSNTDWPESPTRVDYPKGWAKAVPVVPFASVSFLTPRSGIRAAFGAQRAIDHSVAIDAISAEMSSFPVRYTAENTGQGISSDEIDVSRSLRIDADTNDDSPIVGEQVLDVYPGAFLDLKADTVGQFPPAPPEATIARIEFYAKGGLTLCGIPLSVWAGNTANNSGELERRAHSSLVSKCRQRIESYSASFERVMQLVNSQFPMWAKKATIEPVFADPAMPDELYVWDVVTSKIEAGMEPAQAFLEAGVPQDLTERIRNIMITSSEGDRNNA